jgi:hypothetical protein
MLCLLSGSDDVMGTNQIFQLRHYPLTKLVLKCIKCQGRFDKAQLIEKLSELSHLPEWQERVGRLWVDVNHGRKLEPLYAHAEVKAPPT